MDILVSLLLSGLCLSVLLSSIGTASAKDDPLGKGFEDLGTKKAIVLKKADRGTKLFAVRGETTVNSSIERVGNTLRPPGGLSDGKFERRETSRPRAGW